MELKRLQDPVSKVTLRIQICPKNGISPNQSYDLGMGCVDHQSYSRDGSGFLGL